MISGLTILLGALTALIAILAWRWREEARTLRSRYASIIDLRAELKATEDNAERTKREQRELTTAAERERAQLSQDYNKALSTFEALKKEVALLEENLEDISFGLYKPHFNFATSDEYKVALENLRNQERQLIRVLCTPIREAVWANTSGLS